MKRVVLIIISIGLITSFCAKQLRIPEVSPHIKTKRIFKLISSNPQISLLKHGTTLIYFTANGDVVRLDPGSKSEHVLHRFNKPILPLRFHQQNRVLLEFTDHSANIVFDLATVQFKTIHPSVPIDRCLAIGKETIVYHKNRTLHFYNYRTGKELKRLKTKKSTLFNAHWLQKKLLILSSRYLYAYHPGNNRLESYRLADRPTSPFLYHQDAIYYGNSTRELVKTSLATKKIKWRHRISKIIKVAPLSVNRHIAVISEDNNIYFFTAKGSLHWWQKLESSRLSNPVVMKKNIGIFLRPATRPTIKFFNSLEKSTVAIKLENKIRWQSRPVYYLDAIYTILQDKEDQPYYLTSIGNRYDVEIQTTPMELFPIGRSIKFELKAINLIKPEFKITLSDQDGKGILDKTIEKKQPPHFIWIPKKSGLYQMDIEAHATNIKNLKITQTLEIKNVKALIHRQIYLRQKACRFDHIFKEE